MKSAIKGAKMCLSLDIVGYSHHTYMLRRLS
jgi:hypothetical protein